MLSLFLMEAWLLGAVHTYFVRQQEDAQAVPGLSDRALSRAAHGGSADAWGPYLPGGDLLFRGFSC